MKIVKIGDLSSLKKSILISICNLPLLSFRLCFECFTQYFNAILFPAVWDMLHQDVFRIRFLHSPTLIKQIIKFKYSHMIEYKILG